MLKNRSRLIRCLLCGLLCFLFISILPNSLSLSDTSPSNLSVSDQGLRAAPQIPDTLIGRPPQEIYSPFNGYFSTSGSNSLSRWATAATRASAATPFVAVLSATKTATVMGGGNAGPGSTLMYTVTIANSSPTDAATNVMFSDTIDINTTLVAGSVAASPIALNDGYQTIGNVDIQVPAAQGLLANDLNPNGTGTLTITGNTTPVNGAVTINNADGSFTYTPNAGFRGPTDTFTYTLGNGTGKTDTAIVTITINGMIWFVNNDPGAPGSAPGDGRRNNPFRLLTGANSFDTLATDQAGDNIFLHTGTANYTGGLTLLNNQRFIGQGAPDSILTITGLAAPSGTNLLPATGGTDPTITTAGTSAITLGQNNQLHGFTIGNTGAAGTDISGTGFGNLTVRDVTLNGSGQALNLMTGTIVSGSTFPTVESAGGSPAQGIRLNAVGGSFTITTTNIVNPTGTGIDVQSSTVAAGGFNFGSTTVNKSSTVGIGVDLASNTGTISFSSLVVTTSNGTGVAASSSGTVNVSGGSIAATGGPALLINSTTLGMTFSTVSSTNSSTTGVSLTSASGSLSIGTTITTNSTGVGIHVQSSGATVNFGTTTVNGTGGTNAGVNLVSNSGTISMTSGSSVTGAGGTAFNVNAGTATISFAGNITQNAAQRVVVVDGITGGSVSFTSGTVTGGTSSTGVNINNANGNVSFNNLTLGTSIARINNQAVTITNGNSTATYSLGTVSIFSNNVQGIVATNHDGTLNTTTGTVDAGNATAINIDGPAGLTSLGMTLTRVDSDDAGGTATGIIIQDTNGSFTVNGDGANTTRGGNGSGGAIANKTGADGSTTTGCGVSLNNVTNITLRRMQFDDHQNSSIRGFSVTGFTLQYSTINGFSGTASGPTEGCVAFGTSQPGGVNGLLGSGTIDNCLISGGIEHNMEFYNQSGNLNALTISNSNITDNSVALGADGIQAEMGGTASATISIQSCMFDDNKSQAVQASALESSTFDLTINNCTVTRTTQGNEGFVLQNGANGDLTVHVTNNTISGILGATIFVGEVAGNATSSSNLIAVIKDNIVTHGSATAFPVNRCIIAFLSSTVGQASTANILIDNNTINTFSDPASGLSEPLFVSTPDANTGPSFSATVINNDVNITDPAGILLRGIAIQSTQGMGQSIRMDASTSGTTM